MKSRSLTFGILLASTAWLSIPASAVEVCEKGCVGPACVKDCVREPNATVGRGERDEVIIEERRRRGPEVEIRERERDRRPGVEIELGR